MNIELIELKPNALGYLTIGSWTLWRGYNKDKRKKSQTFVPYKQWSGFLDDIFVEIWKEMIVNKYRFKAPAGLGEFYIREVTTDKEYTGYIDWKESKKRKKKVIKYNFHSDGIKFRIHWSKILAGFKHNNLYISEPYRGDKESLTGTRGLSGYIQKCNEDPKLGVYRAHIS